MQHKQLTLELTWACDIRCAHCSQAHERTHLDLAAAKKTIVGLHRQGEINRLGFTGGEPFLRYAQMVLLAEFAAARGLKFGVVTNGRWAKNREIAEEKLGALARLGLDVLVISHDPYHQAFVADEQVALLLAVGRDLGLETLLYLSRGDATPITHLSRTMVAKFAVEPGQVAVRDVVPVGHGAALPVAPAAVSYFDLDRTCPARNEYNLAADGELLPCCSAGGHAGLSMGNVRRHPIKALVQTRRRSSLLRMLHQHDLAELVIRLPDAVRDKLVAGSYVSACHLCHCIVSEPGLDAMLEAIDADRISLIDKVLHTPAVHARLASQVRRPWPGPPVVTTS